MESRLTPVTGSGRTDEAAVAARLIYESDPPYYDYWFGHRDAALSMLSRLWQAETGSYSHTRLQVWRTADGTLLALASHAPVVELAALQAEDDYLQADWPAAVREREAALSWLFPHLPPGDWYLRTLAVAPTARGRGLGAQLLGAIALAAHQSGAAALHVDVDSGNPDAVRFYTRHGFIPLVETTVPQLVPHRLPASFRMLKKLV